MKSTSPALINFLNEVIGFYATGRDHDLPRFDCGSVCSPEAGRQTRSWVLFVLSSLQNQTLLFSVAQQLLPFVQPRPLIR